MKKFILAITLLLNVYAHNFWIEPQKFEFEKNELVKISLFIGHLQFRDEYSYNPYHVKDFVLQNNEKKQNVLGIPGAKPAGLVKIKAKGNYVIYYHSKAVYSELKAQKFESYLQEEKFDEIIRYRYRNKQNGLPGKELYVRCAKSIIGAKKLTEKNDFPVGLPLEILLIKQTKDASKKSLNNNNQFAYFKILFNGKAISNLRVEAISKENKYLPLESLSDKKGIVKFSLDQKGVWLIRCVHMIKNETHEADWKSYWSSLTFKID